MFYPYIGSPNSNAYYLVDIVSNNNIRGYDVFLYNCVQVSMDVLLKGSFSNKLKYTEMYILRKTWGVNVIPNIVYLITKFMI